jgi:enoyl-CoA hydratase/carnithine racemase
MSENQAAAAVIVERENRVARVTINRPEVHNALDSRTMRELEVELRKLADDTEIRCVILRGSGDKVFISGGDLREFRDRLSTAEGAREYDAEVERMQAVIREMPKPVIAQIQGYAIGAGCVLAVVCDFRIASTKAKLGIPIAKFGFMRSVLDTVRLAELVGLGQARRLLMTGSLIDSAEALRIGLIDQLVKPEKLETATEAFAASLAANAPLSIKATKQMLETFYTLRWNVADADPWYRELYTSDDLQEGLDAFFAKRPPAFKGR